MFMDMSFGGHTHSFLLGKYLGVELLSHMISKYLALVDIAKQFSKIILPSTLLSAVSESSSCSTSSLALAVISLFLSLVSM